jgi:hypothetical protein
MDFGNSLALSLSFLFLLAHLSHSAIQLPGWLGDKNTYKLFSFSISISVCVCVCVCENANEKLFKIRCGFQAGIGAEIE